MTAEDTIRTALTSARYTAEPRDPGYPYSALAVKVGSLPGEIWVSDNDGYTLYATEDHDRGLWARYYPDPADATTWHDIYRSNLTDLTADLELMLPAFAEFRLPTVPRAVTQL